MPKANVEETGADIPPVGTMQVSERGSIWSLGRHRVGCGDATNQQFVERVLESQHAHIAFVDPPYNIPVDGFISGKGRHRHREFVQGAGELSSDQFSRYCVILSRS